MKREQIFGWTEAPTPASPELAGFIQIFKLTSPFGIVTYEMTCRTRDGEVTTRTLNAAIGRAAEYAIKGL